MSRLHQTFVTEASDPNNVSFQVVSVIHVSFLSSSHPVIEIAG